MKKLSLVMLLSLAMPPISILADKAPEVIKVTETISAPAGTKVALVDFGKAIFELEDAKDSMEKFKDFLEKFNKEADELFQKFMAEQKRIKEAGDDMSKEAKEKAQKDLTAMQADLQEKGQRYQELQMQAQQIPMDLEDAKRLEKELKDIVETLAKKNNIDLIVPQALYVKDSCNLTSEVVKMHNSDYKAKKAKTAKKDKKDEAKK
ncbi:MAG: Calponin domain-containing protein [candidate division TM6 bacterium GW2011_GWF2_32_72]|nr:MAG: Calponin domain-containing protein [candidate division TM6 bacterium GW2011_GWF2_32_72]